MEFISEDINASEVKSLQKEQQIRPTTLLVSGKGSRCELTN